MMGRKIDADDTAALTVAAHEWKLEYYDLFSQSNSAASASDCHAGVTAALTAAAHQWRLECYHSTCPGQQFAASYCHEIVFYFLMQLSMQLSETIRD